MNSSHLLLVLSYFIKAMVARAVIIRLIASAALLAPVFAFHGKPFYPQRVHARTLTRVASYKSNEVDVIVVGSGLGGLVCAATVASYGYSVAVLEAHTEPGGAAQGFSLRAKGVEGAFHFDTGPSFFSGLTGDGGGGSSPLRDALDALGLEVPCATYSSFGLCLPEGDFMHTPAFKESILRSVAGPREVAAWERLQASMAPLAAAVGALPAAALRVDPGVAATTARYLPGFAAVAVLPNSPLPWEMGTIMTADFGKLLDKAGLKTGFGRNWLDLLCFCLSGLPANGTVVAEMAMMMGEFYKEVSHSYYSLYTSDALLYKPSTFDENRIALWTTLRVA
jgi:phytoene dehydrogenase-like protein